MDLLILDETPTPTRFIRNCEEVGLFQDLQNVNPFEETFKRANELVKSGNIPTPSLQTDDTLHTPHVFPVINNNYTSHRISPNPEFELKTPIINITKTPNVVTKPVKPKRTRKRKIKIVETVSTTSEITKNKVKSVINNKVTQKQLIPIQPVLMPSNSMDRMVMISNTPAQLQTFAFISQPILQSLPQTPTPGTPKIKKSSPKIKSNESKVDEERLRILQRNRAASDRARKKQKQWVANLVKQNENFKKLNSDLIQEVKDLKLQLAKYQSILMAHKDCDVSKNLNLMPELLMPVQVQLQETTTYKPIRPNIPVAPIPTITFATIPKVEVVPSSATIINASNVGNSLKKIGTGMGPKIKLI